MIVRLTEKGRKLFGWGKDRPTANFSDSRAHALMVGGNAVQDRSFMAFYEANNPHDLAIAEAEVTEKDAGPAPDTPGEGQNQGVTSEGGMAVDVKKNHKSKKEKAASRKAEKREKAVTEDK